MGFTNVKYQGGTPAADANTYVIFNSIQSLLPGNWPALFNVFKIVVDIKHDQAGTLKWYKNMGDVDASGWVQMGQLAVSAPASTAGSQLEVFVEAQRHSKVEWVNGGTAQSPFSVNVSLSSDRAQI